MAETKGNMGASHNSDALLNVSMSRHSHVGNHNSQARPASAISAAGRDGGALGPSSRIYANQAPVHPSRLGRPRPIQVFNPSTESELTKKTKLTMKKKNGKDFHCYLWFP